MIKQLQEQQTVLEITSFITYVRVTVKLRSINTHYEIQPLGYEML